MGIIYSADVHQTVPEQTNFLEIIDGGTKINLLHAILAQIFGNYPTELVRLMIYGIYNQTELNYLATEIKFCRQKIRVFTNYDRTIMIGNKTCIYGIILAKSVYIPLINVRSYCIGESFVLALKFNGELYSMGSGGTGQLGLGNFKDAHEPTKINIEKIKFIACNKFKSYAISFGGQLYEWGHIESKRSTTSYYNPKLVDGLPKIFSVCCSDRHTIALTTESSAYVWGKNYCGELGLEDMTDRFVPTHASWPVILSVSCTNRLTATITPNHSLYVYGHTDYYNKVQGQPVLENVQSVQCGDHNMLVLMTNGELCVWRNGISKVKIENISSFLCTRGYNFVTTVDSEVYGWGENVYGQLRLNGALLLGPSKIDVSMVV